MASQEKNEPEFWESLENSFGREIPVDSEVRDVINGAIKESRKLDPEKRAKVIDAAVYLANDIVTVAFRGEDAKVAKEAKVAAEECIKKELKLKNEAEETAQMSSKGASEQEASGAKIPPEDFSEQSEGVEKLETKGVSKGEQEQEEQEEEEEEEQEEVEVEMSAAEETTQMSSKEVSEQEASGAKISPGDFLEQFEWVAKLKIKDGPKEAADKYGKEELELMHEEVSAAEEITQMSSKGASEQEASGAKISPEEFLEQPEGVETLETKGVPKGKQEEEEEEEEEEEIKGEPKGKQKEEKGKEPQRDHYVINKSVSDIYREIIEKFVEKYRERIFNGKDYQKLVEDKILIHEESGLPTFPDESHLWWADVMQDMKDSIERLTVSAPSGETHSDECDEAFSKAKKELLNKVIHIMFYVFKSRVRGEKLHDHDSKIERLGKTINMIIYPDLNKTPYGVYLDHQALVWWQKKGGDVTDFFNSIDKVRNMFQMIPDFVADWGDWALRVHNKLRAKASSSQ